MGKLEALSQRAYPLYLATTIAFALLGYLWLALFPLIAVVLTLKLPIDMWYAERSSDWLAILGTAVINGLCIWITVDLVRARIRVPGGHRLSRERYPELWARVDQLCAQYKVNNIDRIRIIPRFDLEVERTPVCGLPAQHTHTLLLGLGLLQVVSGDHLSVLIARRLSLLPTWQNWPVGWLYHLRTTWHRYSKDFAGITPGRMLMQLWFRFYARVYEQLTLPLARRCELMADQRALHAHDLWSVEEAISTSTIRKAFVENKLWPAMLRMSQKHSAPPLLPYANMEELIQKELDKDRAHRLLDGLFASQPQPDVPTATLKQRWKSLSTNRPRVPVPVINSAAQHYLKSTLKALQEASDQSWLRSHLPQWRERNARANHDRNRLQRLLAQVPKDLLSNDDVWECTLLVRQYMGQEKAVELYKALLATRPEDARVYFNIGSFLLSCRDQQGVDALETAMTMDGRYTPEACEMISEFMRVTGERRRAKTFQRRAIEYSGEFAA